MTNRMTHSLVLLTSHPDTGLRGSTLAGHEGNDRALGELLYDLLIDGPETGGRKLGRLVEHHAQDGREDLGFEFFADGERRGGARRFLALVEAATRKATS